MTTKTLDASVVIASHNRTDLLINALRSLSFTDPLPTQVVVVDDGSQRPIGSVIPEGTFPFELRVIRIEMSVGPAAARDLGVHNSRGEVLLFTDDDCTVTPHWVGSLVRALRDAEPRGAGGVGGRVLAKGKDTVSRYMEFHRILEPKPHDALHPERIPYLVTANCAVTREAFMRAAGFDRSIPFPGGEDAAFSMRLAKQGYFFERVEDALVYHQFRPNLLDFVRTFYRYGLGGRYVVDRYLSG